MISIETVEIDCNDLKCASAFAIVFKKTANSVQMIFMKNKLY